MSQNDVQKFSRKQQLALTALLSGASQAEAAEQATISLRTLQRWLADDHFSKALNDSIAPAITLAAVRLASLADKAISVLDEVMADEKATIAQKMRSANFSLGYLVKVGEYADVTARIDAIEARLTSLDSPLSNDNNGA